MGRVRWNTPTDLLSGLTPTQWLEAKYPHERNETVAAELQARLHADNDLMGAILNKAGKLGLKKTQAALQRMYRYQSSMKAMPQKPAVNVFNDWPTRKWDSFVVTSDWHIPYHNHDLFLRMVTLAERWRPKPIRNLIIGGDFMDFGQLGIFTPQEEDTPRKVEDDLEIGEEILDWLATRFDDMLVLKANHENRLARAVKGEIRQERLARLMTKGLDKIKFSNWTWCVITDGQGPDWRVTHPSAAWKNPGRLAQELADTHTCNLLMTHNHIMSQSYNKSGDYHCIDCGGMFNPLELGYYMKEDRPRWSWCPGFVIVSGGKPHTFNDKWTDWQMYADWLGIKEWKT